MFSSSSSSVPSTSLAISAGSVIAAARRRVSP
jgi:hypothetical protein